MEGLSAFEQVPEEVRVERLLDAQEKASQLFDEIERRVMIRPGVSEQELSGDIHDLAAEMFGVTRYWHRRVVRAGENTLVFKQDPHRPAAVGSVIEVKVELEALHLFDAVDQRRLGT